MEDVNSIVFSRIRDLKPNQVVVAHLKTLFTDTKRRLNRPPFVFYLCFLLAWMRFFISYILLSARR